MTDYRINKAQEVRNLAAKKAADRVHIRHQANGDEERYASANYAMSFTKGLEHDPATGLIQDPEHYRNFRSAIDNGMVDAFTENVAASNDKARPWEAPTAGLAYDLQGPDSQAVTMPPAPALGSSELAYEMAEVYELALLRDVNFSLFSEDGDNSAVEESCERLNEVAYALDGSEGRSRLHNSNREVTPALVFRGSSPGVGVGPYVSQFLLIGNPSVAGDGSVTDGVVRYGPLQVNQRVPVALEGADFMTDRAQWLSVQNGADPQTGNADGLFGPANQVTRRFISTPRDLATYVHYDALYQAYLNACLILIGMKAPFDPGFDALSGRGTMHTSGADVDRQAGGFALWGDPHILTLVTEVATRALKAVRFQKFNNHIRLRPEALAGRIEYANAINGVFPIAGSEFLQMEQDIHQTTAEVRMFNAQNGGTDTALLPMAFQEGSPMHPSYGAGHATVAGACITILKAFFDTSAVLVQNASGISFKRYEGGDVPVAYAPDQNDALVDVLNDAAPLTLEGELNKLAANISIGRNMAGVHYYSDYYDSLRMGEEIAIGILEEQALCYPTDHFVMSLPTFDGDVIRIGRP
ncbi:MAG: vanadium-dependent haloperoxidase [Pseudomonadota bacterium]